MGSAGSLHGEQLTGVAAFANLVGGVAVVVMVVVGGKETPTEGEAAEPQP